MYHRLSHARRTTKLGWADKVLPGVPKNGPGGGKKLTVLGMHHPGILTKCYLLVLCGPETWRQESQTRANLQILRAVGSAPWGR